ncbi:MAG: hypothetical protein M9890_01335 [Thermomicrobiales bacterium]|nr:hypothetical protein [Thermomicrobiales bacterium]
MIADISSPVRRVLSWSLLCLACAGFLLLGLAERDARAAVLRPVPEAPLPFARHKVVGLDLRSLSSLESLQWLRAGGVAPYALVIVQVDSDIVTALTQPDDQPTALAAMDEIVAAAQGTPLAVCLSRPVVAVGGLAIAQAVAEALVERYPGAIAYVLGCGIENSAEWHRDLSRAIRGEDSALAPDVLIPLSAGATLTLFNTPDDDALGSSDILGRLPGTDRYSAALVALTRPADEALVTHAREAITNVAALALVLVQPERSIDPAALSASFNAVGLNSAQLPEGFSSVTAPGVAADGDWILSTVGTVPYARTTTNAAIALEFVGTNVFVQALTSPDGGTLLAWIDPPADDPTAAPIARIDLEDDQASDTTIQIATGLPGQRHRLILAAENADGQSVSVSGVVVTGQAAAEPIANLAATALLVIAVLALSERALANIRSIRENEQQRPTRAIGHPRVFKR